MIFECAQLTIDPSRDSDLQQAVPSIEAILSQAQGFRSLAVGRCVETEGRYQLRIEWERLEDHTEVFRGSDLAKQLGALLAPLLTERPTAEHYQPIDGA